MHTQAASKHTYKLNNRNLLICCNLSIISISIDERASNYYLYITKSRFTAACLRLVLPGPRVRVRVTPDL